MRAEADPCITCAEMGDGGSDEDTSDSSVKEEQGLLGWLGNELYWMGQMLIGRRPGYDGKPEPYPWNPVRMWADDQARIPLNPVPAEAIASASEGDLKPAAIELGVELGTLGAAKYIRAPRSISQIISDGAEEAGERLIKNALQQATERGMRVLRGPGGPDAMVDVTEKLGKPMSREKIREVIHEVKRKMNIGADEDLVFDFSGGLWDSRTGEFIGKIWEQF